MRDLCPKRVACRIRPAGILFTSGFSAKHVAPRILGLLQDDHVLAAVLRCIHSRDQPDSPLPITTESHSSTFAATCTCSFAGSPASGHHGFRNIADMTSPVAGTAVDTFALNDLISAVAKTNGLDGAIGPADLAADALVVDEIYLCAFGNLRRGLGFAGCCFGLGSREVSQQGRRCHGRTSNHEVSSGNFRSCVVHNYSSSASKYLWRSRRISQLKAPFYRVFSQPEKNVRLI